MRFAQDGVGRPVSRFLSLSSDRWQPFIWDACCQTPLATYPELKRGGPPHRPLFGLAPHGVYPAVPVARDAVRSYRTISPLPRRTGAVYFLRHFPSTPSRGGAARPLAGTLPCGDRTFLGAGEDTATARTPDPVSDYRPSAHAKRGLITWAGSTPVSFASNPWCL